MELGHLRWRIGRKLQLRIFRALENLKALYVSEPWIWRGLQQAPERRPGGPLGRRNQDSCLRIKFGQGLPENDKDVCFPSLQKIRSLDGNCLSSLKKCSCALVQVALNLCAGVWDDEKSFPHRRLASHDCPRSSGGSGEFPQNCHF